MSKGSRKLDVADVDKETEQMIKQATEGMPKEAYKNLLRLEKGNAIIIAKYLIAYKAENDVEDSTRFNQGWTRYFQTRE